MAELVKCKTCGEEIAKSAKTCPKCGARQKKPILQIVLFAFVGLVIIGALFGKDEKPEHNNRHCRPKTATKVSKTKMPLNRLTCRKNQKFPENI